MIHSKTSSDLIASRSTCPLAMFLLLAILACFQSQGLATQKNNIHLKMIENRHWLLKPDGSPFFAHGITHVNNSKHQVAHQRIAKASQELGFNAFGYGCPRSLRKELPYLEGRNILAISTYRNDESFEFIDIFDPAEQNKLEKQIEELCLKNKDNPNLIGYCWTDLGAWPLKNSTGKNWVEFIRNLPKNSPGKIAYQNFSKQWQGESSTIKDRAFLRVIARTYFTLLGTTNRRHDPDHLIFGDRLGFETIVPEVLEEMLPWVDAIALQPPYLPFFPTEKFDQLYLDTGKPILICDFAIRFKDGDTPVRGILQPSDRVAGQLYSNYIKAALKTPYIIGSFWCNPIDTQAPFNHVGIKQGLFKPSLESRQDLNQIIRDLNLHISSITPQNL
jgi:hypothetical protein